MTPYLVGYRNQSVLVFVSSPQSQTIKHSHKRKTFWFTLFKKQIYFCLNWNGPLLVLNFSLFWNPRWFQNGIQVCWLLRGASKTLSLFVFTGTIIGNRCTGWWSSIHPSILTEYIVGNILLIVVVVVVEGVCVPWLFIIFRRQHLIFHFFYSDSI